MTAVTYLGGYQNPETKEVLVDLEMAKRTIDTIELLKEKTKGNLTVPESNLLDNTLYNLRMTYIRLANNPPSPPHVGSLRIDNRSAIERNRRQKLNSRRRRMGISWKRKTTQILLQADSPENRSSPCATRRLQQRWVINLVC